MYTGGENDGLIIILNSSVGGVPEVNEAKEVLEDLDMSEKAMYHFGQFARFLGAVLGI